MKNDLKKVNSKNELQKVILKNLKNEFKKINLLEIENANLKLQLEAMQNGYEFKPTPTTKVESMRQLMISKKCKRKDVLRHLMCDLRGVSYEEFDNNYSKYSSQSSTNFTRWFSLGNLTKDKNGFYVVTPRGKKAKSLYSVSKDFKIERLEARVKRLHSWNGELIIERNTALNRLKNFVESINGLKQVIGHTSEELNRIN